MATSGQTTLPVSFGLDLDAIKDDLAGDSAVLLLHWRSWIRRRTETVRFLDDIHVRRSQTVDFSIEEDLKTFSGLRLLPIALLAKRPLRDYDLRDASGKALPMLTRHENVKVGRQMLVLAAAGSLSLDADEFEKNHPDIAATFGNIVDLPSDEAMKLVRDLEEGSGPGSPSALERLRESAFLMALAPDLARNFALFVALPDDGPLREIVKFAYDERLQRVRPRVVEGNWFKKKWAKRDRLLRWLGISSVEFRLPAPAISEAESYHVEIVAPEDLVIEEARLFKRPHPKGEESTAKRDAADDLCAPVCATDRAHLSTRDRARGLYGEISVTVRVRSSRIFAAARNISAATTLILAGGLFLHLRGVPSHGEVASLLLVVLPGLYATYLARPGEHRLVQRLVSGIRLLIALQAGISFVAAAALALGLSPDWKEGIWSGCLGVSLVGAILTTLGNHRSAHLEAVEAGRRSLKN